MYKSLQAGRAFAAIFVVLYHLGGAIAMDKVFDIPFFAIPFSFGSSGVEFFFVLSGFIIMKAHRRDIFCPGNLGKYLIKRVIRIYPTYWIIFFLASLMALFSSALQNAYPQDAFVFLKSLLLIPQDKAVVGGTGAPVVDVAWSLQYEITFYALFAVIILSRLASLIIGLLWLYAYILYYGNPSLNFPLSFLVNDYILLFFFGMVVSIISEAKVLSSLIYRKPIIYLLAGGGIFIFSAIDIIFKMGFFSEFRVLMIGISSALIIFGLVISEDNGRTIGGHRWLQVLGNSSYSLYLIHVPIIAILCKVAMLIQLDNLGTIGALIAFLSIFASCILVSVLFHLWIEVPVTNYLRNFTYRVRLPAKL